jgi:hypothetical protein
MNGRFIFPNKFSNDTVSLFSIIDIDEIRKWPTFTDGTPIAFIAKDVCQGFGVLWNEDHERFLQIFSYTCATIDAMKKMMANKEHDDGGFNYICFKSHIKLVGTEAPRLTDRFYSSVNQEPILTRLEHHSSRYFYLALQEATYASYSEARKEAQDISQKIGYTIEEIIPESIRQTIEEGERGYRSLTVHKEY